MTVYYGNSYNNADNGGILYQHGTNVFTGGATPPMNAANPFTARKGMIAIGGMSGSGKSTLAESLGKAYPDLVILDSDVLHKQMHGVDPKTPLPLEAYAKHNRERLISYLHAQAAKHLRAGKSVVVTGTFLDHDTRHKQEKLASRNGADFIGLYLHAPLGTLYDRVARRKDSASDATPSVVQRQFKGASKRPVRDLPWCVIRADKSPRYVLDSAIQHIRRHVTPRDKLTPRPKKTFKSTR